MNTVLNSIKPYAKIFLLILGFCILSGLLQIIFFEASNIFENKNIFAAVIETVTKGAFAGIIYNVALPYRWLPVGVYVPAIIIFFFIGCIALRLFKSWLAFAGGFLVLAGVNHLLFLQKAIDGTGLSAARGELNEDGSATLKGLLMIHSMPETLLFVLGFCMISIVPLRKLNKKFFSE